MNEAGRSSCRSEGRSRASLRPRRPPRPSPRTPGFATGPKAADSFGLPPSLIWRVDNLAEPSHRIDEDAPTVRAGVVPGWGAVGSHEPGPQRPPLLRAAAGRAGLSRLQEGNVSCPPDRI